VGTYYPDHVFLFSLYLFPNSQKQLRVSTILTNPYLTLLPESAPRRSTCGNSFTYAWHASNRKLSFMAKRIESITTIHRHSTESHGSMDRIESRKERRMMRRKFPNKIESAKSFFYGRGGGNLFRLIGKEK
jgi:hypothetical protein